MFSLCSLPCVWGMGRKKQIIYLGLCRSATSNAKSSTFSGICYCIHYRSWTWFFSIDIKESNENSWSNNQTGALINAWKENFYEIEKYRQPSAWLKVNAAVDNHGPEKSMKQIKAKLGRLKDAYKQVKDNNSRMGAAPQSILQ